jgi:hypothetical protein
MILIFRSHTILLFHSDKPVRSLLRHPPATIRTPPGNLLLISGPFSATHRLQSGHPREPVSGHRSLLRHPPAVIRTPSGTCSWSPVFSPPPTGCNPDTPGNLSLVTGPFSATRRQQSGHPREPASDHRSLLRHPPAAIRTPPEPASD